MVELRISELSKRSGTPIATIKYYIREGLISPSGTRNTRESTYHESTIEQLKLIKGLVHVVGIPISQVRQILDIIKDLNQWPGEAMTRATVNLPLSGAGNADDLADTYSPEESARVDELLAGVGLHDLPDVQYVNQTKAAMALANACGVGILPPHLEAYTKAARDVAQADFTYLPMDVPARAVQVAVLGTTIYEPILLGLRRLAHREIVNHIVLETLLAPTQTLGKET
jgi:DNA-binding transcriptional MerR regulator